MAVTEAFELDGVTIGTTEISILSGTSSLQNNTTPGVYQLWVDPLGAPMAKGDRFIVRVYEKVKAAGTKRLAWQFPLSHAQSEPLVMPGLMLLHGWDMTLQKTAGTDRAMDASVRKVGTVTEAYSLSAVTVGATELSIVSGTTTLQVITTPGAYQLWIDPIAAAMAKADDFRARLYEKVEATGGTKRQFFQASLWDANSELFITPTTMLINGWDATLQKIAGTDRAFDASIRKAG